MPRKGGILQNLRKPVLHLLQRNRYPAVLRAAGFGCVGSDRILRTVAVNADPGRRNVTQNQIIGHRPRAFERQFVVIGGFTDIVRVAGNNNLRLVVFRQHFGHRIKRTVKPGLENGGIKVKSNVARH